MVRLTPAWLALVLTVLCVAVADTDGRRTAPRRPGLVYLPPGRGEANGPHPPVTELHQGDVLRLELAYPLHLGTADAALKVECRGARALDLIGECATPDLDAAGPMVGGARRSAFLYAALPGKTEVHVWLADGKGKRIKGHGATYFVAVKAGKG